MLRFTLNTPFDGERKILVTLQGNFEEVKDSEGKLVPVGQITSRLQRAFTEAASAILTPTYLPWLEGKGGACPAFYPNLLAHTPATTKEDPVPKCSACGKRDPEGTFDSPGEEPAPAAKKSAAKKAAAAADAPASE